MSTRHLTRADFMRIARLDPDGWTREPTDADRDAFRAMVVRNYGQAAWETYLTNWDWVREV